MKLSIKAEKLSRAFKKHHIQGLPFEASFNEFSAPDTGDPHDHPFDFITHILSGGYTERNYSINAFGEVAVNNVERNQGHHITSKRPTSIRLLTCRQDIA
jgi:hypothetical protein